MLRVAAIEDFKGADTVLVWGDAHGVRQLHAALLELASGEKESFTVGAGAGSATLSITVEDRAGFGTSRLDSDPADPGRLHWTCSRSVADNTAWLVAALDAAAHGHQYVDVSGPLAAQLIFSKGEYPEEMDWSG